MTTVFEMMRAMKIFQQFTDKELTLLAEYFKSISYNEGEFICRQGEESSTVIFLVSGEAEALSGNANDPIRPSSRLGPNSMVGLVSVFDEQPRMASVVATGPVVAVYAARKDFSDLRSRNGATAYKMLGLLLKELCTRLRLTNELLLKLQMMDDHDTGGIIQAMEEVRSTLTATSEFRLPRREDWEKNAPI